MAKKPEKRKYRRIKDESVSLKVSAGNIDIITKSLDISAAGVYCKVEKEVPLLSRIKVLLILPPVNTKSKENLKIETDGVVVREHPVIENGKVAHYDIAVFFDNISVKDKEAILAYINGKTGNKK